jgi:hypothetical protein
VFADAAAEEPLDGTAAARQAAGREEEACGGAENSVQILLREFRAASVDIGGGL